MEQQLEQKLTEKEAASKKQYEEKLQTTIKDHDQKIKSNLTKQMDQKLSQELKKKDAESQVMLQQAKQKIISETKKFEEAQKVQEIAEIHNQNKKRVK